jgi:hypothetical protein
MQGPTVPKQEPCHGHYSWNHLKFLDPAFVNSGKKLPGGTACPQPDSTHEIRPCLFHPQGIL